MMYDRIRYHQGQMLKAEDLQDDTGYEAWLRHLHTRALHNTWGVAIGMEMGVAANAPQTIAVGAGMAYDRKGREIVSSETVHLTPPALPPQVKQGAWFDLVVRYHPLDGESQPHYLDFGEGRQERPLWRWAFAGELRVDNPPLAEDVCLGEEIPLGRVAVRREGGLGGVDLSSRRTSQGLIRPHIASGQLSTAASFSENTQAWSAWVDTGSGGFSSYSPQYFVRLAEHPLRSLITGSDSALLRQVFGPFLSIRSPSLYGFHLDVRFATPERQSLQEINELSLVVHWTGVESVSGCRPPFPGFVWLPIFTVLEG